LWGTLTFQASTFGHSVTSPLLKDGKIWGMKGKGASGNSQNCGNSDPGSYWDS
jgi:hypothetical protein